MDVEKFYSKCLQGNVLDAIDYLKSCENKTQGILALEQKYIRRFITQDEDLHIDSEDPWIQTVLSFYHQYYISVLTNHDVQASENHLAAQLADALGISSGADLDEIEIKLESVFKKKGYSFLGGRTTPYCGPYIWKTTGKEEFQVELPCGAQAVTVFFITDFLMLSWLHFATFGKHHAGGWAKEEGIYYVNTDNHDVDTRSADFQVWFLKHEAQHLSDYSLYPNLNTAGLEYRAKLVELIYYPDTQKKLASFIIQAKNDPSLPHPYAAYLIVKGLSEALLGEEFTEDIEEWRSISPSSISNEARNRFMACEQMLQGKAVAHELANALLNQG